MTILIGAIHDNVAYVGADSLWTFSSDFIRDHTTKFLEVPTDDVIIVASGEDKFSQILEKIILRDPKILNFNDRFGLMELADTLRKEVDTYQVGDADNNQLPDHNLGFLLVSKKLRKILIIESDYSISLFDDYVCAGSGCYLGEAAMKSLSKKGVYGYDAVVTAIETVNELHPYCGGKIEIREIRLDE